MELQVFVTAAKELNFALTAKRLRLAPSQVSKAIASLEGKMQKRLFVRTTRRVRLSQEGETLLPVARQALDALRDAEETFREAGGDARLEGQIRISCPITLGVRKLAALAGTFQATHPGVRLDFELSDGYLDLVEERIDMAVRVMGLRDSSLIARKLGDNPVIFCASKAYLKRHGRPKTAADLGDHKVLFISQHGTLSFKGSGRRLTDVTGRSWIAANQGDFLVKLALEGAGVLARSAWAIEPELDGGALEEIRLDDELVSETAIYAVHPAGRYVPRRLRAWIDHLAAAW